MQQNRCHFDARKKLQKRSASTTRLRVEALEWRRRWDSNPRAGSSPTKRFRIVLVTTTSIRLHVCQTRLKHSEPQKRGKTKMLERRVRTTNYLVF